MVPWRMVPARHVRENTVDTGEYTMLGQVTMLSNSRRG